MCIVSVICCDLARVTAAHTWQKPSELVLEKVGMILRDDGFKVPSPRAAEATKAAAKLLAWCGNDTNQKDFETFSKWLVVTLRSCFEVAPKTWRVRVERMWEKYHELRVSDSFRSKWDDLFQKSLGTQAMPTLFQYVTRLVFKELLAKKYAVCKPNTEVEPSSLSWEEENALRYVGGYVCRKVWEKLVKSSLSCKEDMLSFIVNMCGDEGDDGGTETWTNDIDRGGLWHSYQ